jgi:hypothetical protein
MTLDKQALQAYCEDVGRQMIAYCRQIKGKRPEVIVPFVVDPRPALEAYEAAKPDCEVRKAITFLTDILETWQKDGYADPWSERRIESAIALLSQITETA